MEKDSKFVKKFTREILNLWAMEEFSCTWNKVKQESKGSQPDMMYQKFMYRLAVLSARKAEKIVRLNILIRTKKSELKATRYKEGVEK